MVWLTVKDLEKSYPTGFWGVKKKALGPVSLKLELGRAVGLVGPNGAGKTTLIRLILQFVYPDRGSIEYLNRDGKDWRTFLGYLPERPYFYLFLTAMEFLRLHWDLSRCSGGGFSNQALRVLDLVGLTEHAHRKLGHFSKGMLQRIGIAAALIHDPEILIFDEPMSGLDPDGRLEIRKILAMVKDQGKTLLFSSHLLEDVERLCDDILIFHEGLVSYFGPISDLFKNYSHRDLYEIICELKKGRSYESSLDKN